jgi:hypothetical protein
MISTLTLFVPSAGPARFQAFGPLSLLDAATAEFSFTPHHH